MRLHTWSLAAAACSALAVPSTHAQIVTPIGSEFGVNTFTVGNQRVPGVARDAAGNFVVSWMSLDQDGSNYGAFARRFASTGAAIGAAFQVNTYTTGGQGLTDVAMESNGDFAVTWGSFDGSQYGVFVRRYTSAGAPLAGEMQLNTYTTNTQFRPSIAMDADGDFVVAWGSSGQDGVASYGVFARRMSSNGVLVGAEFRVNAYTPGDQAYPEVAADAAGNFIVAWNSSNQDHDANGVFARLFSSTGAPGTEFQVNVYTSGGQSLPRVDRDADGDFVISWNSYQDGFGTSVRARRFNALGVAVGGEVAVNAFTLDDQLGGAVGLREDGRFVVVWQSDLQDGDQFGLFGQAFDSNGNPVAAEFQVNDRTTGDQQYAAIAMGSDGDFVVVWHSQAIDGNQYGISARRFATLAILDIDGNGEVAALTDGLLVIRYMFGFTGTTLTSGAVGAGCTRCLPGEVEPYLAGLV